MQLSTRGRYAVMAMVDLAVRARCATALSQMACAPVCLSEIAASQHLSLSYLEQLFGRLRHAGLVTALRGPGGGYRLARPASEVSIAAIVAAVDEQIRATRCEAGEPGCMAGAGPDGTAGRCQTHDLWFELGRQIRLFLEGVTLADVVDGQVAGRAVATTTAQAAPIIAAQMVPTPAAHQEPVPTAHAVPSLAAHAVPILAGHAVPILAAHAVPALAAQAVPVLAARAAPLAAD
jgi:Rrf2 family iron-sulfur cluster assembly transcriptional regulator